MGKKRILIAETCVELSAALCQLLERDYDLHLCHNGPTAKQILEAVETDVLVIDLALPQIDGMTLLKWIGQLPNRPKVLVTCSFMSDALALVLAQLQVDMIVMKPCKVDYLAEQIVALLPVELPLLHLYSRHTIGAMLLELAIPPHRYGYRYLEDSIELYLQDPNQTLTKSIYPEIANRYDSNALAVERAIRKLIRDTHLIRDDAVWSKYFGMSREGIVPLPTNAKFIATIATLYKQVHSRQA